MEIPPQGKAAWQVVPLHQVCRFKPSKSICRNTLADDAQVSFVPMNDLGELVKYFEPKETRTLGEVIKSYTYFADGDVLCAKITPCFENGKLGIARHLRNGVGFGSSEFVVMRTNAELLPEFLYYFLSRDTFRECGAQVMSGAVGHKRVPNEYFENLPIPLPSLKEQKRIVAVLDHAFAALDRARANANANLADAEKLFESWVTSVFECGFQHWRTVTLPDISTNLDRLRVPITQKERKPGNVPYYGASGVVDRVADYIFDDHLLLVSEDGANLLARTYPIAFSIAGKSWVNNHAHVLKFDDRDTQEFVRLYLNSISIEPFVSGMAQPKLNQAALNRIPIPCAEIAVRKRVVAEAREIWSASNAARSNYAAQLADIAALRQSLLQKAFAGELS